MAVATFDFVVTPGANTALLSGAICCCLAFNGDDDEKEDVFFFQRGPG
jgi:hypothetical protein